MHGERCLRGRVDWDVGAGGGGRGSRKHSMSASTGRKLVDWESSLGVWILEGTMSSGSTATS